MGEKRKPGRPRLPDDQQGVPVAAWITVSAYDRLYQQAQREEKSISGLVRELLERRLAATPKG